MQQRRFQLAKEYEAQIKRLRDEILRVEKCSHMALKTPQSMGPGFMPDIYRDLNEFPRMKAAIMAALEEELAEYEKKLLEL